MVTFAPSKKGIRVDTRIIKIVFAALNVFFTGWLFFTGHWGWGIFMVFVAAVAVLICFRSLRLIMVFFYIRQQKLEPAKKWLARINPDHLWKSQKGYYHFMVGSTEVQTRSMAQSEKSFRQALAHGLRMDHDKAAVYLNLAVIMGNKRKKREAVTFLNEAKRYDTKGYMKNEIKQVQKMLNSI
jgi:hypothetical protein